VNGSEIDVRNPVRNVASLVESSIGIPPMLVGCDGAGQCASSQGRKVVKDNHQSCCIVFHFFNTPKTETKQDDSGSTAGLKLLCLHYGSIGEIYLGRGFSLALASSLTSGRKYWSGCSE